jgi:3-methyladenine DNA glycosylase Tag
VTGPTRCTWASGSSDLMLRYHDEEWGVPSHDDRHLFEMLILEGAQAGLSWNTILNKRENYRRAFDEFDKTVADMRKRFKFLGEMGAFYFLYVVGEQVPSYEDWCRSRGREPMTAS